MPQPGYLFQLLSKTSIERTVPLIVGIKSLNRYLNQYAAADSSAKDITHRLIDIEERLSDSIKEYL